MAIVPFKPDPVPKSAIVKSEIIMDILYMKHGVSHFDKVWGMALQE